MVDEAHAVLDPRTAVGDAAEVAAPELLLLAHAKRAVVRGDDVEVVAPEAAPQLVLVPLLAQGRREDVPGAAEPRLVVRPGIEEQVVRAGLSVRHHSPLLRPPQFRQRVVAAQVHDVDGRARHLGDGQRAVRALRLQPRRAGQRVVFRLDVPGCQRGLYQFVDDDAVLGVHADERAVLARLAHGPKDGGVVREQHAGVGHEQLVAGHPLVREPAHLRDPAVGQVRDDHVERVVDGRLAGRLPVPGVQALQGGRAAALHGEIDDAGGAAERCRAGARLERIGGFGAAERHLHVGVGIDPARDDKPSGGVYDPLGGNLQVAADQRHGFAVDEDVGAIIVNRGYDAAVLDQYAHELSREC